jgi:Cys-tRNA(Pro)/Cys-tRNA(Cys) deacylase
MEKTIAMKLLEGRKIPYTAHEYPDTERDAEQVAVHLGAPAAQVFKTLVVPRPKKPILAIIPADRQLDLKKLAKVMGEKKLKMATHKEAEELTGLQVGGISPIALLNKGFVMVLENAGKEWTDIFVSSGKKGINLKVPVAALQKLTNARWADIT